MSNDSTPAAYEPPSETVWKAVMAQCERYQANELKQYRTIEVLIAAGFLNREKFAEARTLVENLP